MQDFHASLVASLASVIIFAPFDVARTKLNLKNEPIPQLLKSIYKTEGVKGFYRGLAMSATTTPLSTSLYLSLYSRLQKFMGEYSDSATITNIGASLVTGVICNTITNPLWLLKTRIQTSNKGLIQNASEIYNSEGVKGYYRGLGASFLGLAHLALYFPLYEMLKTKFQDKFPENKAASILAASSISKFVSLIATYPNSVLLTKIQTAAENTSFVSLFIQTYKSQGLSGLFSGLKVEVGRSLPANAMTFLLYESLKSSRKALVA